MALPVQCPDGHSYIQADMVMDGSYGCPTCREERRSKVIWAAGFFDGEGYVGIERARRKDNKSYAMRCSAKQVDRTPLDILVSLWGGSVGIDNNHKPRPIHHWTICAVQARKALEDMLPFLVVKRSQAEVAIRFQARRDSNPKITSTVKRLAAEPENEIDRLNLLSLRAA